MISGPGRGPRGLFAERPGGSIARALSVGLLLLALTFSYAEDLESLRSSLAAQSSASDFALRLEKAVDASPSLEDALSLLSEFVPAVKDGEARRSLLLRQAGFFELAGRWEEAAACHEEAAFAVPGRRDAESLLASARDLLASGETEKASSILRVLGLATSDAAVRMKARVLEGWAALIGGRSDEARGIAEAAASEAKTDGEARLSALVLLWASSERGHRAEAAERLSRAFPGSPEAALVESGEAPPFAHWLLTSAGGSVRPESAPKPGSPVAEAPPAPTPSPGTAAATPKGAAPPADGTAPAASPPDAAEPGSTKATAYQVGAFVEEANASALVKELGGKGFSASIVRKERGGRSIWSVLVRSSSGADDLLLRLKDAGYEAYPVF